ncbi:aldehyde dehydrogenase (NADP(+)) [Arcobacter sp. CECT 8986]|uniref:aldehyde dehydrogenase (NADP(+)) n=1 Tax=Arcobacter sp. CECT 8986 TaxID=2044507 RepID=UPI0010099018|nr:aldehyde dehydrogenase (NADP(+)) [Arcobacter sp. CECT 8986]RXJ98813.1 aldehyde dehydrogenase (NADP(+)) [Arcobacter sp. CECT 8986]
MSIHGKNFIGNDLSSNGDKSSKIYDLKSDEPLEGEFFHATNEEVDLALKKANKAFYIYKDKSQLQRANFLETIADEIMNLGDELILRTVAESNLPKPRIEGERGRTVGQLRMFANLLKEGSWVEATIDEALPNREPLPRNDLRKMLRPIGVVSVFEASNFPLAFACAGGDTASALAAGCPVIVKAHSSHSGTSELIATAIINAVKKCDMPDGTFSMVHGGGRTVGQQIVLHEVVKAVGFTGSTQGGMKLFELANQRKMPIPVFAEMGSINPCLFLPSSLKKAEEMAQLYANSITVGVGQFCTNPGLILLVKDENSEAFKTELSKSIENIVPATMLSSSIQEAYSTGTKEALSQDNITLLGQSKVENTKAEGRPTVACVSANTFIENPKFHEEIFGPYSLVVECENIDELDLVISSLDGQLTSTVMGEEADMQKFKKQIFSLENRCGRILFNGVPTGVEVCHSMQHGGPFPAATDPRFTSVGTGAIRRFVRPVCFQDCPNSLLPDELKDENPLGILRITNDKYTRDSL